MQSFYNGLNGMVNFSKSLDNVSNNISNMNTPGFKANDVFVRALGDGNNGYGTQLEDPSVRTAAGDLRQTQNASDLAITGNGYFIVKDKKGELFYTRTGQFKFDENNHLVDGVTGYQVMSIDNSGLLHDIDISNNKILPPVATTNVKLIGNLSSTATSASSPYLIDNIGVYSATGEKNNIKLEFAKSATVSNEWNVTIKNDLGVSIGIFNMQFASDGSPATGFNSISQTITLKGVAQAIDFKFGATGSLADARQLPAASDMGALAADGHDAQGLSAYSFTEDGIMKFKYAGGDEKEGPQVALAYFNDPSKLQMSNNGLYTTATSQQPTFSKPNKGLLGSIQGKSIEMSNVDLTQEFADILIIQRGYQASSRVMSVSNEILEQLYNSTQGR